MKTFIAGLILGILLMSPGYFRGLYKIGSLDQSCQKLRTAWMADRQAWRDGESFQSHYGPHHESW